MTEILTATETSVYDCICPDCGAAHTVTAADMQGWLAAFGNDTEHVLCRDCFEQMMLDEMAQHEADQEQRELLDGILWGFDRDAEPYGPTDGELARYYRLTAAPQFDPLPLEIRVPGADWWDGLFTYQARPHSLKLDRYVWLSALAEFCRQNPDHEANLDLQGEMMALEREKRISPYIPF